MRQVSNRQMLRIREMAILEKLESVFGFKAEDPWPNGKSIKAVVKERMYSEALSEAAALAINDWINAGGNEEAWAKQCREFLGEEPDGEDVPTLDLAMPTQMHEAIRMREAVEKAKGGR